MPNFNKIISCKKAFLSQIAPLSFAEALRELLRFYRYSPVDIEVDFDISSRTVERYIYGERRPSKRTIVKLLLCISDSYEITEAILYKAGYNMLGTAWEDIVYRTILENIGVFDVAAANALIDELNREISCAAEKIKNL